MAQRFLGVANFALEAAEEKKENGSAEVMQTFDDVEQTKILQRLHEIAVEEAARIFMRTRPLSPHVIGFVQARSWYQDLTPIVVTSPPN